MKTTYKSVLIIIVVIICISCQTQNKFETGVFRYENTGKNKIGFGHYPKSTEQLILKKDSTFELDFYANYSPVFASSEGKWKYISKDTILLQCFDLFPYQNVIISNPNYIQNNRTRMLKIKNNNNIKMVPTYGKNKPVYWHKVDSAYTKDDWYRDRYKK